MKSLFFSDAAVFGGHEQVCVDIAESLAKTSDIVFAISEANQRFDGVLSGNISCRKIIRTRSSHKRGALYAAPVRLRDQLRFLKLVKIERPDTIFLCQGRIETCAPQMFALMRARMPFVSILPFAHPISEIKRPAVYRPIEDWVRQAYYRLPSAFVVPSEVARRQLIEQGVRVPIHVLPNVVRSVRRDSILSCASPRVFRCIGRIDFLQKRQDVLVRLIGSNPEAFSGDHFEFVGEGPDSAVLSRLIDDLGISSFVRIIGALPRARVLEGATAVVMPSRFEGVPLTMLEALSAGVPFIGSNIDIFRDYLPPFAISDFLTVDDLRSVITRAVSIRNRPVWIDLRKKVLAEHSREKLDAAVRDIVAAGLPQVGRNNAQ